MYLNETNKIKCLFFSQITTNRKKIELKLCFFLLQRLEYFIGFFLKEDVIIELNEMKYK